jgi:hypothetical protein
MRQLLFAVLCGALGAAAPARAETIYKPVFTGSTLRDVQERPYVLQPADRALNPGQAFVGNTVSAGRRAGRALDSGGFESLLTLGYGLTDRITLDGFAGYAADGGAGAGTYGGTARYMVAAQQWRHPANVLLTGGALREHDGTTVVQLGYAVSRDLGKLNLATTATFEKAFAEQRDAVDAVVTAGAMYAVASWWRAGMEAAGEDLEAFVEPEEAEGGARVVAGPSVVFELLERKLNLGVHAGGGVAYVPRPTLTGDPATETAFMTRARLVYTF